LTREEIELLVDLYAEDELPEEARARLEQAAAEDPALERDMQSLRQVVELLRSDPGAAFTPETHQRILMRMYAHGIDPAPRREPAAYLQYTLSIAS
jgi:anti-sigma factor RsiW